MPENGDRLYTGRYRVLHYFSDACILFACAAFAIFVGKHWVWTPFIAAVVVMGVGVAANAIVWRITVAVLRPTDEQVQRSTALRRHRRNTVFAPAYVTFAIGWGLIAGSIPSYWPVIGVGLMILVLGVGLPLGLLPHLKRRAEAQGGGQSQS